ncbi:MAG TPA: pilus assembly protein TadG-related protein [Rhizomicrobium sp.]|nr:pilus assembly protein TadG-related protein [Rhizomicrobium sp.]
MIGELPKRTENKSDLHGERRIAKWRELLQRFRKDESGNYLIIGALSMPVLVGMAAFGTEEGMLLHKQKVMQHAADSAAVSAAVAVVGGATDNGVVQAKAVAANYGFIGATVVTANSTQVTVSSPPTTGAYTSDRSAIEVRISQPQSRLFSSIWGTTRTPISARAVATPQGQPCILALDPTASASYSEQGTANVQLINCAIVDDSTSASAVSLGGGGLVTTTFVGVVGGISGAQNITASYGTFTGYHYTSDPYANVNYPAYSGCNQHNYQSSKTETISPGVYCGGIKLVAGANVTMNAGIYYLDGGSLSMQGQSTLKGTGVTIVFTSSTGSGYATASVSGGATLQVTAPTTGPTAGIVFFGDRNEPLGTAYALTGGDNQNVGGAIYFAKGAVQWSGNANGDQKCTQIVADTVQLVGNTTLQVDCKGFGTKTMGSPALLIE